MPYYFSWFIAQLFTDQSISVYQTADGKPIGVCEQGFSLSSV